MIIHSRKGSLASGLLWNICAGAGLAVTLLAPLRLEAQVPSYDAKVIALLPPYCKHTQLFRTYVPGGNNPAEIERWSNLIGPTFIHMHHYCWGLSYTNHALYLSRTTQDRYIHLDQAVREFDYVLRNASPNFALMPEILTKKGENLIRLRRGPLGIVELQNAIALKSDYWPPYAYLSDYFKESGDLEQAREWLEKGLAAAPDAKALKSRLATLGGAGNRRKSAPPRPAAPSGRQSQAEQGAGQAEAQPAQPSPPAER